MTIKRGIALARQTMAGANNHYASLKEGPHQHNINVSDISFLFSLGACPLLKGVTRTSKPDCKKSGRIWHKLRNFMPSVFMVKVLSRTLRSEINQSMDAFSTKYL